MAKVTAETREFIARVTEKGEGLLEAVESFVTDFIAVRRAFGAEVVTPGMTDAAYHAAERSSGFRDLFDLGVEMHALLDDAISQAD
jgi:hypothetical protein